MLSGRTLKSNENDSKSSRVVAASGDETTNLLKTHQVGASRKIFLRMIASVSRLSITAARRSSGPRWENKCGLLCDPSRRNPVRHKPCSHSRFDYRRPTTVPTAPPLALPRLRREPCDVPAPNRGYRGQRPCKPLPTRSAPD